MQRAAAFRKIDSGRASGAVRSPWPTQPLQRILPFHPPRRPAAISHLGRVGRVGPVLARRPPAVVGPPYPIVACPTIRWAALSRFTITTRSPGAYAIAAASSNVTLPSLPAPTSPLARAATNCQPWARW